MFPLQKDNPSECSDESENHLTPCSDKGTHRRSDRCRQDEEGDDDETDLATICYDSWLDLWKEKRDDPIAIEWWERQEIEQRQRDVDPAKQLTKLEYDILGKRDRRDVHHPHIQITYEDSQRRQQEIGRRTSQCDEQFISERVFVIGGIYDHGSPSSEMDQKNHQKS